MGLLDPLQKSSTEETFCIVWEQNTTYETSTIIFPVF